VPAVPRRKPSSRRLATETLRTVNNSVNLLALELGRVREELEHLRYLHSVSLERWETFWREYVQEEKGQVPSQSVRRAPASRASETFGGGLPTQRAPPGPSTPENPEVEEWN
jgi:hypothetical protein